MNDLISRQAAIDAIVNITNSENASALHGYAKKHGLEALWSGGVSDALAMVENLSSAQPENQVHLCDSCRHVYPECPSEKDDVIFGNGKGNDNICACNKYEPSAQTGIIRCKDCKHYGCILYSGTRFEHGECFGHEESDYTFEVKPDDFCSRAERRTDE